MKYWLIRTSGGVVEVLAGGLEQALAQARTWAASQGQSVIGADPSENGGGAGNSQPVGGPSTPTVGFSRTPNLNPTAGATDRNQVQMQNLGNTFDPASGNLIAGTDGGFSFGGGGSGGKGASRDFGTGTGAGVGGNAFGSYLSEDDDLGMTGAYRRALAGRGVKFNNIAGRSLLEQQGRYESPFNALQAAGIDQTTDPDAFYNYVGAGANPYEKGKAAFSQIYNASRGADPTAQIQEFSVPTTTTGYANAGNVARGALGRAGNFVSDRLLSGVRDEYAALPSNQTTNYLEFLRRRLGVQGF